MENIADIQHTEEPFELDGRPYLFSYLVIGMIITEACLNTLTGQLAANGYQLAGQPSYRQDRDRDQGR